MTANPLTPARYAAIRHLDLNSIVGDDHASGVISGHLAVLLDEIDRLRGVHEVAESRHEDIHALLATVDGLKNAEAWDLGMSIAAILDGPAPRPETPADACARCHHPFNPTDTSFDGHARERDTPFCRRCVDRCHESEDAGHRCPVCNQDGEQR